MASTNSNGSNTAKEIPFWQRVKKSVLDLVENTGPEKSGKIGTNHSVIQPRSLFNLGNTCYFNSVLQPLCQTHSFNEELGMNFSEGHQLADLFFEFSLKLQYLGITSADLRQVRDEFIKNVSRFNNNMQHDSHECLRHFLDEIRKEERKGKDSSTSNGVLTSVDKVFGGHLITVYICKECDGHYHLFEPCLDISLPVFFQPELKKTLKQMTEQRYQVEGDMSRGNRTAEIKSNSVDVNGKTAKSDEQGNSENKTSRSNYPQIEKDKKAKDNIDQDGKEETPSSSPQSVDQSEKAKDKIDQDDKEETPSSSPQSVDPGEKAKDNIDQDGKEETPSSSPQSVDQSEKAKDNIDQDGKEETPSSSPQSVDPGEKAKDKIDQDGKEETPSSSPQSVDQSEKAKDKIDQDGKEEIPSSSPQAADPREKEKDRIDQDGKEEIPSSSPDSVEPSGKENLEEPDKNKKSSNKKYNGYEKFSQKSETNEANGNEKENIKVNNYKQFIKALTTPLSSFSTQISSKNSSSGLMFFETTFGFVSRYKVNLTDCLQHFSRVEQIDKEYLCEDCLREAMAIGKASEDNLKLTSATKQTLIFNPPAVLTIHFKRFELLPGRSKKRSDMVEYPEHLDIAPYCSSQCLRNDPPKMNIWYSLYAVVVHSGSLDSGHYVAYVKMRERNESSDKLKKFLQPEYFNHNVTSDELIKMMNEKNESEKTCTEKPERDDSKWFFLNDDYVREVSLREVLDKEAYLLFYERVDGKKIKAERETAV